MTDALKSHLSDELQSVEDDMLAAEIGGDSLEVRRLQAQYREILAYLEELDAGSVNRG